MIPYEHRQNITVAGGSNNTLTLDMHGGLCRQVIVRALTNSTASFRADLVDAKSDTRINWGYHSLEINDTNLNLPVRGIYKLNITNATPVDETFRVILAIEE